MIDTFNNVQRRKNKEMDWNSIFKALNIIYGSIYDIKKRMILMIAHIIGQDIETAEYIFFIIASLETEHTIQSLFERLKVMLTWFSDELNTKDDLLEAGRRIKTYCIEKNGFVGIFFHEMADLFIEKYKNKSGHYFIIGIHPHSKENLILYTTRGVREIRGSDIDTYHSEKSIYKTIDASLYNVYSLTEDELTSANDFIDCFFK